MGLERSLRRDSKGLLKNRFRFCWRLFGCLARRERRAYPSWVCKERATTPDSQTAPALRGGAAPGHLLRCSSVTAHWRGCSWCPCGSTSRLASGQAALPPKSEVIFEQTLRGGSTATASWTAGKQNNRLGCALARRVLCRLSWHAPDGKAPGDWEIRTATGTVTKNFR